MNGRIYTILLITLLTLVSVAAAPLDDARYVTVVTESGGAAGVIKAANFAAAMQVHGYTFTGAVDTDLPGVEDVNKKFLVFIDGNDVTIADGKGDAMLVTMVREYFEDLDYDVTITAPQELFPDRVDDIDKEEERVEPEPVIVEPEVCHGCLYGENCIAEGTVAGGKVCLDDVFVEQKALGESCSYDGECHTGECTEGVCAEKEVPQPPKPEPKPEKKNIFSRVFSWFAGLFS